MVNFCIKVAKHQIKGKRLFIIENPSASAMWSLPIVKALSDGTAGVARVNTHVCCFGMIDPVSGLSMRKSISLLSNLPNELKEDVIKVCKRDHDHQTIVGSSRGFGIRAVMSQVYPMPFCKAMAKTLSRMLHSSKATAAPLADITSDPRAGEGLFLSCERIATNVVGSEGVPHSGHHGSAETQSNNMSIDGEALWEDLAAEDDAVYRRLDDLRHDQANGQSDLISTPALAPDMPVIRGEVPRHSPKLKGGTQILPTIALVARSVGKREMMAEAKAVEAMQKE